MGRTQDRQKQDDLKQLGSRVREARTGVGYTQEVLAKELGISVAYVSLIERGGRNPPWTTVVAIARALQVPLQRLVA
ncbi:MAG: helix-turn-helix transcriptional regulator [Anaeromyxobacter sp.]